LEIINIHNIN